MVQFGRGLLILLAALILPGAAFAAANIGEASKVVNNVYASLGTQKSVLHVGDPVFQNGIIETSRSSRTTLRFLDDTTFRLGSSAVLKLDEFVYNPAVIESQSFVMTMTKGVFQFVSGNLPKQSYTLNTPVVTIGIRGTNFYIVVEEGTGATTVCLNSGEVTITSRGGPSSVLSRAGFCQHVDSAGGTLSEPAKPSEAIRKKIGEVSGEEEVQNASLPKNPGHIVGAVKNSKPSRPTPAVISSRAEAGLPGRLVTPPRSPYISPSPRPYSGGYGHGGYSGGHHGHHGGNNY